MADSAFDTLFLSTLGFNLVCMYMFVYICVSICTCMCPSVCLCVCVCAQNCFYYNVMYYDFRARKQRPALSVGPSHWGY